MTKPIRFAVIGSGSIAEVHAQAIAAAEGAELHAVWSRNPERGEKFASLHGARLWDDLDALAGCPDIDAATIATPSGAHAMAALPFLHRGKGVLCEKPLDIALPRIESMLSAARQSGAPLGCFLQLRLGAGARALKKAVADGRFGRLALCSAYIKWWRDQAYYDSVPWRGTADLDGGGALMNQGIHGVDLLLWLAGMPVEVFAFSARLAHEDIEVEDTITVALRYPHGALGVIEASTSCYPGTAVRIEICGERGSAILENDRISKWDFAESVEDGSSIACLQGASLGSGSSNPKGISHEGHRMLVEDFVQAVRGRSAPLVPAAEAKNAVRLILGAYESAKTTRPVLLDPQSDRLAR